MSGLKPLYNPLTSAPGSTSGFAGLSALSSLYPSQPTFLGSAATPGNALTARGLVSDLYRRPAETAPPAVGWQYVRKRFRNILANITISTNQREDGERKHAGVRACLNRYYWGIASETANSMLIGSWGKNTRGRPSRDIDILFLLPPAVYHRFQERSGNRQSQLLQEVKSVLTQTYSQTTMRGDGQVVSIPFNTIPVEVSIGFAFTDGSIRFCDTNDGGKYSISTAKAELADLDRSNTTWNENTRALIRMAKRWQNECNVPLKSFQLERLAIEFLDIWAYSANDLFWYDWMMRDFFGYLKGRANGYLIMPGTGEVVALGSEWLSRAETAHRNAISACENEYGNYEVLAGQDWQKILGAAAPVCVS